MPASTRSIDEAHRLRSLAELNVLDSGPEPEFDALVQAAAAVCGVPISLISLVDTDRQWFKANTGLPGVSQTPRDIAFCAHAIVGEGILEINNALLDPRFAGNPLVQGDPHIRFYAGATLRLSDGTHAGTLCVIDRQPRQLNDHQRQMLGLLALAATRALEGRRALLAERQLRESASHAAAVLQHSVDAIISTTPDGTVTHWNNAAQRLFGHTAAQMLGQRASRLVPPYRPKNEQDIAAMLARWPLGTHYETVLLHCDGEPISVSVSLAPITGPDGRLTGATQIIRDIREQARAAQALSDSQARYRRLYESTPAMLHSIDLQGRIRRVSDHWLATLGYARDEVIGRPSSDFLTEASKAHSHQVLAEFFLVGRCDDVRYQMVSKSGAVIDVLLSAVLERDAAGQPLRSMAVMQDVTQRLRAERALRDSELLLNRTGAVAGVGGWALNLVTGQLDWSEQTRRIHGVGAGYQPNQADAIHFYMPHDQPKIQAAVEHAMQTGQGWDLELQFVPRSGPLIWVRAVGHAEFEDGKPVRLLGAFQDVTERVNEHRALEAAHQRIELATRSGGIGVWERDLLAPALRWDARMYALFGLPPNAPQSPQAVWAAQVLPEDRARVEQAMQDAITGGRAYDSAFRVVWPDGSVHHLRGAGQTLCDAQGQAIRMTGVNWDVTPLRQLADELAQQHELLRVTLQSIADAVITTDAAGLVTWMNPAAERMTGWLSAEAKDRPLTLVFNIVNEETRLPTENPVATCLGQGKVAGLANHTLLISRHGDEFGIEDSASPIRSQTGDLLGVVLVFHDVTEARRMSGEMSHRATHDALTGLVNRTEFETRLRRVLNKAHEDRSEHALLYIDLDQFKLVNDACGHSVGDELLQQIGKVLSEAVRSRDTLARLGGDEFGVILEHCGGEHAQRVAQQICERMDDFRFVHDGRRFRIGTSIGLVPVDNRWGTTAAVMQAADTSCYAAKDAGRNRVHAWFDTDQAMRARHGEMQWATRLEQALDENRFVLFAQRISALGNDPEDQQGLHAEVLVRMNDGSGALVLPEAFLPAAERFHLASRIDRWVLRHALDHLAAVPDLAAVHTLCINLSGQSIGDRAFHRQAIELLTAAGPAVCRRLCLEITETAAVTNMADAAVFIDQAHGLGIRIALDDFGAGASSFGYLKTLPVDLLKIDGQFIRNLINDPLHVAAVRCFVEVARVVGVKTVAEFVDKPEILARVREIGIDFAQGYWLHRPEPINQVLQRQAVAALS